MKRIAASLGLFFLFMAHVALAADDGQTRPKVNTAFTNLTTATDLSGAGLAGRWTPIAGAATPRGGSHSAGSALGCRRRCV